MSTDPTICAALWGSGFLMGMVAQHYGHRLRRRVRRRERWYRIHLKVADGEV